MRRRNARFLAAGWPDAKAALAILIAFGGVWLCLLSYTSLTPPADNIEQLTWVASLEWGYYKHPPLPTWLVWLPVRLFGLNAWTTYLAGSVLTLGSILTLWALLVQLRSRAYAGLACAAVLCITYYNGRLYYYNHNVVLMLLYAWSATCCWNAMRTGRLGWWVALGVLLGLGALTKYQVAITALCVGVYWLWDRGWRDARQRTGLLMALLFALVVFLPHVAWLRTHDFAPIDYALASSLKGGQSAFDEWQTAITWVSDQLFNRALPAWVLVAVGLGSMRNQRNIQSSSAPVADSSRAFLLVWGLFPLAFISALGVTFGVQLQSHWGTPFLLFAIPAGMELMSPSARWSQLAATPVLIALVAIQALLLLVNFETSPRGASVMRDTHWRAFDSSRLAAALLIPVHQATSGQPVCVISGAPELSGALALKLPEHPLVLIDGRLDRSPWVDLRKLGDCPVLVVEEPVFSAPPKVSPFVPAISWCIRGLASLRANSAPGKCGPDAILGPL